MNILGRVRDVAIIAACVCLGVFTYSFTELFKETAQALIDNTHPPVSIKVEGFSPAAQAVFNKAVQPQKKGK